MTIIIALKPGPQNEILYTHAESVAQVVVVVYIANHT